MTNIKNPKIFFLGCGKMGGAIAQNLVEESNFKNGQITVLKRSDKDKFPELNYVHNTSSLPKGYKADLVFIAVKPQNAAEILEEFVKEDIFHKDTIFISILAGKKVNFFEKIFGSEAKIVRSMPNMPIQDSQGILPYITKNLSKEEISDLHGIFEKFGQSFELKDEDLFDKTTAIFGSGPAYIFYLQEIFTKIAIDSGLDKNLACDLVKTLFLGSSLMSCNSDSSLSELRESVTSKAGTTAAALNVLMNSSMEEIFTKAIKTSAERSKELAND